MYRCDDPTNTPTLPTPAAAGTPGYYTEGTPGVTPPTYVRADHVNTIQEELVAILTAAGITPTKGVNNQVVTALKNGTFSRIKLTAAVVLYVNLATGSDTANTGLTSASPFATIQHAYTWLVQNIDAAGYGMTISVAGVATLGQQACVGAILGQQAAVAIIGTGSVILNSNSGTCLLALEGAWISLGGTMLFETSGPSASCISASNGGIIILTGTGLTFGSCTNAHINVGAGGSISQSNTAYTVSGGGAFHLISQGAGANLSWAAGAITFSAAVTFSSGFACGSLLGFCQVVGTGFTNPSNVSGPRYAANYNGIVFTNGGGASFLPGSTAGSTTTGGQYG